MEAHEQVTQQYVPNPPAAFALQPSYEACEQCAAPVDAAQRYCVECGARRKHVADPAASFMSTATSRARAAARGQQQASAAGGRSPRSVGLGIALAVALIPAGTGLGFVLGHSSNGSSEAGLIAALKAQKQQVLNIGVGGGAAARTAASSRGRKAGGAKHAAVASSAARASSGSSAAGPPATSYKPTAANLRAGAAVVAKVQKTVGKSYVGSQQGLPSVVSVP